MSRHPATLFVRPLEGRTVRKPDGQRLKPEGETVEAGAYWTRRLDDEDVTDQPPRKAKIPAGEATKD